MEIQFCPPHPQPGAAEGTHRPTKQKSHPYTRQSKDTQHLPTPVSAEGPRQADASGAQGTCPRTHRSADTHNQRPAVWAGGTQAPLRACGPLHLRNGHQVARPLGTGSLGSTSLLLFSPFCMWLHRALSLSQPLYFQQ